MNEFALVEDSSKPEGICEHLNESSVTNLKYYAQSRQTGQDFRSAAPPDCRIELCQDDDVDYYDDDEIRKVWMLIGT